MNKKILSLLLASLMMLTTFAGCTSSADDEEIISADTEESIRVSMTLTLALPTQEGTTDEAIEQVEAAINRLTQAKFDTAIELILIPEDEYQDYVDKKLDASSAAIIAQEEAEESRRKELKELKAQGIDISALETEGETESVETEEETIINELGISIKQYPEVGETQFDIFLVEGYENYVKYIDLEYIQQLDSELSSTSKILKTYIYPKFLELAYINGTYAIPNNYPVGEYQYLLVNKELVEQYDYNPDDLQTFLTCTDFIKDIGRQNLEGVVPLLGYVEPANMVYWGETDGEWSILASQITNTSEYSNKLSPKSVFGNSLYVNTIGAMKELTELGYVGDGAIDEGEKFAVGIVSGDASVKEQYEDDYYVYVYAKPMMTEEDAYGQMFAVSSFSKNLSRSMEIITYLNTSSDIRTILQYGVKNVHWEYENVDSEDTIRIISDEYNMNLLKTGNVYMTYPGEGISLEYWEYGKQQNLDSISDPYMKFTGYRTEENAEMFEELAALSKDFKERLDALTYDEYAAAIAAFKKEIRTNEFFTSVTNPENKISPLYIYSEWHSENYG